MTPSRRIPRVLALTCAAAISTVGACTSDNDHQPATRTIPEEAPATEGYAITNARVGPGERWVVSFDAEWVSEGEPERRGCSYRIYDAAGELIAEDTFTLFVTTGAGRDLDHVVDPPEDTDAEPAQVRLRCRP